MVVSYTKNLIRIWFEFHYLTSVCHCVRLVGLSETQEWQPLAPV